MSKFLFVIIIFLLIFGNNKAQDEDTTKPAEPLSSGTFNGLKFRSIGPALTSGRISDFAVNPANPNEYYAAAASGGVWKTTNSGTTFIPVFDNEKSFSIGCLALDPNNPFVVWVGTGENNSQRSVSYGDGIYRSSDGGKSWKNMGLKKSEHIGKILIDPRNSSVIFVAAQGPLWGPGGDRGLYKSTDDGNTWKKVLIISENTGVSDIVMDPRNPDVIYAAAYQRRRHVFTLINGGPESAIYKTMNGGESWEKLTSGLPKVDMGRIGLAVSPVNPDIVYAIVEAADKNGGFFRSTDRGATWEKRNGYVSSSPQYYQEIVCDPKDADRVYSLDTWLMVTDDGGKTFKRLGNKHRHVDDHAMWINPNNTSHYLVGGDGGIYESFDRGENWHYKSNLPVTQFYRVTVDNVEPFYNVYGGTQDNFSLGGPGRTTNTSGIVNSDWFVTNGGDGFESQIDPVDPNIVYAQSQYGGLIRFDKKSGESMEIQPQPGKDEEPFRWNWDSPLLISPHSYTRLYFAANILFRSDDRGDTWSAISGDLTRRIDRNKLPVMGKIQSADAVAKNASTSFYGNIVSLSESPLKEGLIFAGTDDGLINITDDGGKNWKRVEKVHGVPETTYVSCLLASQHNEKVVYASFDNHKNNDFSPYISKSADAGKTWKSISSNLPSNGPVYTIAEDYKNPNLLFAGTEFGVFFSIDGGNKWVQLKGGIPTIAVRDIDIQKRENDLVLATFGRGFYILDDYSVLREISSQRLNDEAVLFKVKNALMYIESRPLGLRGKGFLGESFFSADNPPFGTVFTYYLKESIKTKKQLRQEAEKEALKKGKPIYYPTNQELKEENDEEHPYLLFTIYDESNNLVRRLKTPASAGMNRITWDLRMPSTNPAKLGKGEEPDPFSEAESGVLAAPGKYKVVMSKGVNGVITDLSGSQEFDAVVLGMTSLPAADRQALVSFQKKVGELSRAVFGSIELTKDLATRIKLIRESLYNTPSVSEKLSKEAKRLEEKTNQILVSLTGDKLLASRNENTPPSISDRVQNIIYGQWRSTSSPTQTQKEAYTIAGTQFSSVLADLKQIVEIDLKQLEEKMEELKAPWTPGRIPDWKME